MLAPHLHLTPTEGMSRPDWLALRQHTIGGSDIGTIMGLNPWCSPLELFYRFVDSEGNMSMRQDNLAMQLGHDLEPVVANLYEFWDGDEASLVANRNAGKKVAEVVVLPYHIINPAYPHLHVNLDRGIRRHRHKSGHGVLEIKTIAGIVAEKYEGNLPPSYITQVQHEMLVSELEYADLAMLKDGRTLEVYEVPRNESLIAGMLAAADDFHRRITEGRAIWADATMGEDRRRHEISQCEPAPSDVPAEEQFLKQRWRTGGNTDVLYKGGDDELGHLAEYLAADGLIKTHEATQQAAKNHLLRALERERADVMLLPEGYKLSYRADKHGKRTFRVTRPKSK